MSPVLNMEGKHIQGFAAGWVSSRTGGRLEYKSLALIVHCFVQAFIPLTNPSMFVLLGGCRLTT